jgi:hypothetical protein
MRLDAIPHWSSASGPQLDLLAPTYVLTTDKIAIHCPNFPGFPRVAHHLPWVLLAVYNVTYLLNLYDYTIG